MNLIEIIKTMPKIELHLHLEGAFTLEFLFYQIQKYGGDPTIHNINDLEQKFLFRDFPHFIEIWFWKNQFFKEAVDFESSTYSTLENLCRQNVIYLEAFYSPWDFVSNGISVSDTTEATLRGIFRAEKDFGIQCKLIADISRDMGWENAASRFDDVVPYKEKGVIGIGLGGSEQKFPADLFERVYQLAKAHGFHVVAHAGEAAGPESVWTTIHKLDVERIGHGVRAIEDPQLVEFLKQRQIPLEICVNSNIKTDVFSSINNHPIKYFLDHGLLVTVNSDDPTMFGMTLTEEYIQLYEKLNFSLHDIQKLNMNSVNASFLSETEKACIADQFNNFWRTVLS